MSKARKARRLEVRRFYDIYEEILNEFQKIGELLSELGRKEKDSHEKTTSNDFQENMTGVINKINLLGGKIAEFKKLHDSLKNLSVWNGEMTLMSSNISELSESREELIKTLEKKGLIKKVTVSTPNQDKIN